MPDWKRPSNVSPAAGSAQDPAQPLPNVLRSLITISG